MLHKAHKSDKSDESDIKSKIQNGLKKREYDYNHQVYHMTS